MGINPENLEAGPAPIPISLNSIDLNKLTGAPRPVKPSLPAYTPGERLDPSVMQQYV